MKLWTAFKTSLVGISSVLIGAVCNAAVIQANGGRMPVFDDVCMGYDGMPMDYLHACAQGATRLAGLTDWIHIGAYIYSPGDGFLAAGQLLTVTAALVLLPWAWFTRKRAAKRASHW